MSEGISCKKENTSKLSGWLYRGQIVSDLGMREEGQRIDLYLGSFSPLSK